MSTKANHWTDRAEAHLGSLSSWPLPPSTVPATRLCPVPLVGSPAHCGFVLPIQWDASTLRSHVCAAQRLASATAARLSRSHVRFDPEVARPFGAAHCLCNRTSAYMYIGIQPVEPREALRRTDTTIGAVRPRSAIGLGTHCACHMCIVACNRFGLPLSFITVYSRPLHLIV